MDNLKRIETGECTCQNGYEYKVPYLTNAFSPSMLGEGGRGFVEAISLDEAKMALMAGFYSAISHEVTASVVASLIGKVVDFNRTNITLKKGDTIIGIVPKFRAEVAREFTLAEITEAGYTCFRVEAL
jgi:hypothetical protein